MWLLQHSTVLLYYCVAGYCTTGEARLLRRRFLPNGGPHPGFFSKNSILIPFSRVDVHVMYVMYVIFDRVAT